MVSLVLKDKAGVGLRLYASGLGPQAVASWLKPPRSRLLSPYNYQGRSCQALDGKYSHKEPVLRPPHKGQVSEKDWPRAM